MAETPPETMRFEGGDLVEIRVNGTVVGRVERRPESSVTAEDEAALALEVDQLVKSLNEQLRDVHEAQPKEDLSISAEIIEYRGDTVEVYTSDQGEWRSISEQTENGPNSTDQPEGADSPPIETTDSDHQTARNHTITGSPPEATRFEDAKHLEIKRDEKIIARVEHRPVSTITDSEVAGLSLILESMVDDFEETYVRQPYEILKDSGATTQINASGTDGWITRVE